MSKFVLEAKELICDYSQDGDEVRGVLIDDLKIPKVGVTVIFGSSGSGKSTLLSLIAGSRKPTQINSKTSLKFSKNSDIQADLIQNNLASRGSFGFIFQEPYLIKSISARSNAEIAQQFVGESTSKSKIDELAAECEMLDVLEQRADTLSGGQAQRIAVIRALALDPDILVCDEPTSSLDEETGDKLLDHIYDWAHSKGKCVLLVTHNLEQAAKFGDYFIRIDKGRLEDLDHGEPLCLAETSIENKLAYLRTHKRISPHQKFILKSDAKATATVKKANIFASFWFTWQIMLESFYLKKTQRKARSSISMVFRSWYAPLGNVSIVGLLALGLVVFTALLKIQTVGTQYFERELSRPELRHFTIKQNQVELNLQSTSTISNALNSRVETLDGPVMFTRRETFIQSVLPSEDGSCPSVNPRRVRSTINAPMLVYEKNEPLYADFTTRLEQKGVGSSRVLATRGTFLEMGAETSHLCIDVDGNFVSREVVWINEPIPGGADRTFVLGMSEEDYREASAEVRSVSFQDKRFSEAAIYFNEQTRDDILCIFDPSSDCLRGSSYSSDAFLINKEVFNQIKTFTTLSYAARQAIYTLVAAFILVMSVAVGFSMNAEVKNQEKSLAILRAFGVTSFQISAFFQMRTIVQTLYIIGLVLIFFTALLGSINTLLIGSEVGIDVKFVYADLHLPILLSIILTQLTTFGVVMLWAYRNKFVSERLQGL